MIPPRRFRYFTEDMNAALLVVFSMEGVLVALQQMHSTKAPGIDGMSTLFNQKFWDVVRDRVFEAYLHILNKGGSIVNWNRTTVMLILKVKEPIRITKYRRLSLCNVVYKLVTKTVANRLKTYLESIIAPN